MSKPLIVGQLTRASSAEAKAEATTRNARAILHEEQRIRDAKSEKLRALRLSKSAIPDS